MSPLQRNDEHLAANRKGRDRKTEEQSKWWKLTWGGGVGGRGEVTSEAREEEGIRGGGREVAGERVGTGGEGAVEIEWRLQPRHRPQLPRLRPHLRAVPGRWVRARRVFDNAFLTTQEQLSVVTMADEDTKLFDQCRICIVCSNDLPLETAEQVCIASLTTAYNGDETHKIGTISLLQ